MIEKLKVKDVNEIGDPEILKNNSLKGYVSERKLIRYIKQNISKIEDYLLEKHKIKKEVFLKDAETKEKREKRLKYNNADPYEKYTSSELLIYRIIGMDAKSCISAFDIFEDEGIEPCIDFIHKHFPLMKL